MFGIWAVCYLFLGGAGSGVLLLCSILDLVYFRPAFSSAGRCVTAGHKPVERFLSAGFIAGEILLLMGIGCLVLDLGVQDRILSLFYSPSLSILTIGAYTLGLLALLGFFLVLPRLFSVPSIRASWLKAAEMLTIGISFVSMLYTGLLLFSMKAVDFWDNPLLTVLFVLSSLSSGTAALVIIGFFSERSVASLTLLRKIVLLDSLLILLEIVSTAALVWVSSLAESAVSQQSLKNLLFGPEAPFWWLGFVLCGMLIPLLAELLFIKGGRRPSQTALAIAAVMICVGAFCLRYGLVEVGSQGDLIQSYLNSEVQNSEFLRGV